jgi:hypothetical protein
MHKMIFVNLPVADLGASRRFFTELGYSFHEDFCDDKALCLVLGDRLHAMLLRRDFFQTFTPREVADAKSRSEVLIGLDAASRGAVDELVDRAVALGGSEVREPQEHGDFMYGRSFADPDGHIWEILWMDLEKAPGTCQN